MARGTTRTASARSRRAVRETAVEALTPDFAGKLADVATVVDSGVDVFAQNLETVERLTHRVRDARAGYDANAVGARVREAASCRTC